MQHTKPKKLVAVWLDHKHAQLLSTPDGTLDGTVAVQDRVSTPERHGGGSESAIHNAQRADLEHYWKELGHKLEAYDEIMLFGTGTAQEQLRNHLAADSRFRHKHVEVENDDRLSEREMLDHAKAFFRKRAAWI